MSIKNEQSEDIKTQRHGYIDSSYAINLKEPFEELSTDFAKAYAVSDKISGDNDANLYALLFENSFPVHFATLEAFKKSQKPSLQKIVDSGKIILTVTQAERFAIILQKPSGKTLEEIINARGAKPLDETFVTDKILNQLTIAIDSLGTHNIVHGSVNPRTVYFNQKTGKLVLKECCSEFCGFSQSPEYESIDRLLCDPAGKGFVDITSDYFSLGMVVLYLLTGTKPFAEDESEVVLQKRLENGSCDETISYMLTSSGVTISHRMENLLKALLTDNAEDRWSSEEITKWYNRREMAAPVSKVHKQAMTSFIFAENEYVSRKFLAYEISQNWIVAKRALKLQDLSRWLNIALKRPDISDELDALDGLAEGEIILTDSKLTRIITILDPEGPIRLNDFSCHILGLGSLLVYAGISENRDIIQNIGTLFHEGFVEHWIRFQRNPDNYGYGNLHWGSRKIREHSHKKGFGFGMERILYELNTTLSCQSVLLKKHYITNLHELIIALNEEAKTISEDDSHDTDPMDRHIAAFIAHRIELSDDIHIKSIQNFPHISKNPQVLMTALLSVAQNEGKSGIAKNLTAWIEKRLSTVTDILHSKIIKKDIKGRVKDAAKSGNISEIFKVITAPAYVKKDLYGFHEARMQYTKLSQEIAKLKTQSNLQKMSYKIGLRISVTISYLVCMIAFLYLIYKAT